MFIGIGLGIGFAPFSLNPIIALFGQNQQGAWYDPSDMSTLFQDAAGATPVTAVEQPVGLMLDKRLGLVRGPELVVNGTFDADVTGWVSGNGAAAVTWQSGALLVTNAGVGGVGRAVSAVGFSTIIGKNYEYSVTLVSRTAVVSRSSVTSSSIGTGEYATIDTSMPGIYKRVFTAVGATTYVTLINQAAEALVNSCWDNISVKLLDGNHASQATAASRLVLSARVNLLTKTEQFNDASWIKLNTSTTADQSISPTGDMTADLISDDASSNRHIVYQSQASVAGATYTSSHYLRQASLRYAHLLVGAAGQFGAVIDLQTGLITSTNFTNSATGSAVVTLAANGFWRLAVTVNNVSAGSLFSIISTSNAAVPTFDINGCPTYAGSGQGFYAWGAQLETGTTATRYQRVNTASDYDTVGFPMYAKSDGVDDSMSSATGGGGTAGFFFCQAVKPTGGAGAVRTLWSDIGTNSGYRVQLNASNQLSFSAGNGTAYTTIATATATTIGATHLLTVWDDGTNLNVQLDSGTVATVARPVVTAGTAGFTLGKDNGAATGFFTGNMYPEIYRQGSGLAAAELAQVQAYVKSKAGL